jgi:Cation efflux family
VPSSVALYEVIVRLIDPQSPSHLWALAAAGAVGFIGNEVAARVRVRAGRRLDSPALVADGNHARVDGFVSLGVVASALVVSLAHDQHGHSCMSGTTVQDRELGACRSSLASRVWTDASAWRDRGGLARYRRLGRDRSRCCACT